MNKVIRNYKILALNILIDSVMIALSYVIAISPFFALDINIDLSEILLFFPIILIIKIFVFILLGVYRIISKRFGFEDILKLSSAVIVSNTILIFIIYFSDFNFIREPYYVFITTIEILLLCIVRTIKRFRYYFLRHIVKIFPTDGIRTMIIGAGLAGEMTLKEIENNDKIHNYPVIFVDDDIKKIGKRLKNIKVYGPINEVPTLIKRFRINEVIIAISDYPKEKLVNLVDSLVIEEIKVKRFLTVKDLDDQTVSQIESIKVEDLLNRDEIFLDNLEINDFIKDEVVLVTGGGGSIGSELCRQIASYKPKQLIIFDIYENNAYEIQMELKDLYHRQKRDLDLNLIVLIGSVYNKVRLEEVFKEFRPTLVFHAAAYKHVPLMEDSAVEAIRTNVIGTYYTTELAKKYRVKKFVLVSSDKAVRPTNVMGATKRLAELVVQNQNRCKDCKTIYSVVRFGNVLGSNGSVIPLFKKQIANGGPVTVTHKEITRYFMTIPEAVGLILQSAVYALGDEVFVLDMGEPVKIYDLAEKMIRLAGHKPNVDINIEITGLRPGEKLYEELLVVIDDKIQQKTPNKLIFIDSNVCYNDRINIEEMIEKFETLTNQEVKEMIASYVSSYHMNGNGS